MLLGDKKKGDGSDNLSVVLDNVFPTLLTGKPPVTRGSWHGCVRVREHLKLVVLSGDGGIKKRVGVREVMIRK